MGEHSYSRDVMYGDRMKVQSTFSFQQATENANDVILSQWVEVIWMQPLPWTHKAVTVFVEKFAVAEAERTARFFAQTFKDVVLEIENAAGRVDTSPIEFF